MTMEARIVELETRLAFQDDTIQALNDALVEQQKLLDRLQLHMAALSRRQEEIGAQFETSAQESPPPHY